jgi:hypothetical protein
MSEKACPYVMISSPISTETCIWQEIKILKIEIVSHCMFIQISMKILPVDKNQLGGIYSWTDGHTNIKRKAVFPYNIRKNAWEIPGMENPNLDLPTDEVGVTAIQLWHWLVAKRNMESNR